MPAPPPVRPKDRAKVALAVPPPRVWFHPFHNNFLSAAHTEKDITDALRVTEHAFEAVAAAFGTDV